MILIFKSSTCEIWRERQLNSRGGLVDDEGLLVGGVDARGGCPQSKRSLWVSLPQEITP